MDSGDIIRMARDRAGLTQEQVAERTGRPRTTITRWERGTSRPSFAAVEEVVSACGFDMVVHLANRDTSLEELVAEQLGLAPIERLSRLLPEQSWRQSLGVLRWVARGKVPAVVIGAVADVLQGAPQRPRGGEVEIVSSDPYLMEMEMRDAGFTPLDTPDRWLDVDRRQPWRLQKGGTVVLADAVPGTTGYGDLKRSKRNIELDADTTVAVAHPRDLLRLADASPRDTERARVPALRALMEAVDR